MSTSDTQTTDNKTISPNTFYQEKSNDRSIPSYNLVINLNSLQAHRVCNRSVVPLRRALFTISTVLPNLKSIDDSVVDELQTSVENIVSEMTDVLKAKQEQLSVFLETHKGLILNEISYNHTKSFGIDITSPILHDFCDQIVVLDSMIKNIDTLFLNRVLKATEAKDNRFALQQLLIKYATSIITIAQSASSKMNVKELTEQGSDTEVIVTHENGVVDDNDDGVVEIEHNTDLANAS